MLVRSTDFPSSTTTACNDNLKARSFSSRLRFRRIDSKSSTMLLDLFTVFAPIIYDRSFRHGGYRHVLPHSWNPIRGTMASALSQYMMVVLNMTIANAASSRLLNYGSFDFSG
jgi:hypothetical protein